MLFNTAQFAAFFIVFYVAFYFVAVKPAHKLWLIAIASLYFYGCWNWKFVFLLVGTGVVDYYIAQAIDASTDERHRKRLLALSVSMNLGVLAAFKYTNFVLANVGALFHLFGVTVRPPMIDIVLPIGISFYTFQSISYTVDVYRGAFKPRRRVMEFLASLTFFPHLVAGPIVRSSTLLPQFEAFRPATLEATRRGMLLIAFGLTKKTLADLLAPQVEVVFASSGPLSALEAWAGALSFTGQIYGDFSGYTDIAIGVSLLLGFVLPANFDLPYLSTSPAEFWRRWHISLSSWLRDYLYMPLAYANRRFPHSNIFLTMGLGGLWHGASWTFVIWGMYQGLLLFGTEVVGDRVPERWSDDDRPLLLRVGQTLLTFYLVIIGWVLFRAKDVASAWTVLRGMHSTTTAPTLFWPSAASRVLFAVGVLVFCHGIDALARRKDTPLMRPAGWWIATSLGLAVPLLFGGTGQAFIYFQF